eukprot:CAMPEP_0113882012 /NCGR_PEP_ID=MMETSP0780_2-20120614/8703_1 /TAXON_ID=652834 /ORGANISM="Palpitomonas bilix" /LENGTH=364 /DNA_ID=CAMNT_0000868949 /DNA_START=620 /DNA_END=1711 /DNA_ORIENTATION=+ /assembly_acc=CAM_ASM_000599
MSEIGCCYIDGHHLDFASTLTRARSVFDVDVEEKRKLSAQSASNKGRGFLLFGAESGREDTFEPKEGFSYGYDWDGKGGAEQPSSAIEMEARNVWPSSAIANNSEVEKEGRGGGGGGSRQGDVRKVLDGTFSKLCDVNVAVLRCLSLALTSGETESMFDHYSSGGEKINLARIFHYFDASKNTSEKKRTLGSSEHTDWGSLTLIVQDEVGGLQAASPSYYDRVKREEKGGEKGRKEVGEEEWVTVGPRSGLLVCNAGDFLSLVTNGAVRSPIHRVLPPPPGKDRMSVVFFAYPHYDLHLSSLPQFESNREEMSKAGAPTSQAEKNEAEKGVGNVAYNTLLSKDAKESGALAGCSTFGEYISQKW